MAVVVYLIEEFLQIKVDHVVITFPYIFSCLAQPLMGIASGPEAITMAREGWLVTPCQYLADCLLDQPVLHCRYP